MSGQDPAPGCRETALVTGLFLVAGATLMAIGLTMIQGDVCVGACPVVGLATLYAGGPVSAVFGVLLGGVPVAWPLDVTFWVSAGFLVARWADKRERSPLAVALLVLVGALVYGLVLSQFVELDITQ